MKYALLILLILPCSAWAAPAGAGLDAPLEGEEIIPLGTDAYTPPPAKEEHMLLRNAAQPELLGQGRVGNRASFITIPLRACGPSGYSLKALRLRFLTGPVLVPEAFLYLANGSRTALHVGHHFSQNTESQWIAVAKGNKPALCPRALVIRAQNANLTPQPAAIQVFGLVGR